MHPSKWQYFVESLCAPLSLEEAGDPQYWALNPPTEESIWLALWEACAAPHYWMQSEPRPFDMDSDVVAMVRSVTEDSEITAWWRAPIDRPNQRSVEWLDDHPSLTAPQVERTSLEQWVRRASTESGNGPWWSAPLPPTALHTSRATTFAPAVHLIADEDDHGFDHARIHVLSPLSAQTRIYEIASRDDWVALVDSAPVDVSRSRDENWGNRAPTYRPFPLPPRQSELPKLTWWIPNWATIAERYDGVHLTTSAYLQLAGVPIEMGTGNTMIAGWGPDETVWLNDLEVSVESRLDYERQDDIIWSLGTRSRPL